MKKERQRWGTKLGVIMAVAGSAVGLGNFLRFPVQAAKNGGGAFLIPYFVALVFFGVPLMWVEWTAGRFGIVPSSWSPPMGMDGMIPALTILGFAVFGGVLVAVGGGLAMMWARVIAGRWRWALLLFSGVVVYAGFANADGIRGFLPYGVGAVAVFPGLWVGRALLGLNVWGYAAAVATAILGFNGGALLGCGDPLLRGQGLVLLAVPLVAVMVSLGSALRAARGSLAVE